MTNVGDPGSGANSTTPVKRKAFKHPGRFAIVAGGIVAVLSIFLIAGFSADTTTRTQRTPNGNVTDIAPEPNTIVPPQSAIIVDLRDDLFGTIEVCGPTKTCTPIPEDQLSRVKALGRLTFQPGTGKEITRYQPGSNTVVVHIERQTDPGVEIDIYEWSFTSKS
ncbi:hypothetical protein IMCC26256_111917 [Actinobacteria bacterium IMCC26256]|nr:hypothetical protein IMCC26256_111917 [Actinobacteria bacterium IMCC26256]